MAGVKLNNTNFINNLQAKFRVDTGLLLLLQFEIRRFDISK